MERADVVVIGGGAVGLATAWQLVQCGVHRVLVLEQESAVARHQTGRNSGVLHSGIYYEPGSLKAETCRRGKQAMQAFCADQGVAHEICGKVVVATSIDELPALKRIQQRALANGVVAESIGPDRLRELEPNARGIEALWVRGTGIVDFVGVCRALVRCIQAGGGELYCRTKVTRARSGGGVVLLETTREPIEARVVVACPGLQADRVARLLGIEPKVQIVPIRGEYHLLGERGPTLVRNLIYPVPDPRFPFLGVHFTRRFDGSIDCGPNAVLALGREAYAPSELNLEDALQTLCYPGFLKFAWKHLGYGLDELRRSLSKHACVETLRRLVPSVTVEDLRPGPSGIRAQAVSRNGELHSDFLIEARHRVICMLNAPSPAATASLEIGRILAEQALRQLN